MNAKQAAAERAVDFIQDGMTLGLGTGSTVQYALEKLAGRVKEGMKIIGVPTSKKTEISAQALGIPLASLEEIEAIDLTIDGADEIDPQFCMIKGGGGALLREKIIASITKTEIIVVGRDKLVEVLGKDFLLPVEVLSFGWKITIAQIEKMGCSAHLRKHENDDPVISDNGNYIVDCNFGGIPNPAELEGKIDRIPGVLEIGLFVGLAQKLIIGEDNGKTEVREAP